MKKFLFLLAAVACVAFASCSKDDGGSNNPEPEITLDGYDEPYIKWGRRRMRYGRRFPMNYCWKKLMD